MFGTNALPLSQSDLPQEALWNSKFDHSFIFPFIDLGLNLPAALTGIDSAFNVNEYQENFLRCKGGRNGGMTTLPLSCAYCLEIWVFQPAGNFRAFSYLQRDCFTFYLSLIDTRYILMFP